MHADDAASRECRRANAAVVVVAVVVVVSVTASLRQRGVPRFGADDDTLVASQTLTPD